MPSYMHNGVVVIPSKYAEQMQKLADEMHLEVTFKGYNEKCEVDFKNLDDEDVRSVCDIISGVMYRHNIYGAVTMMVDDMDDKADAPSDWPLIITGKDVYDLDKYHLLELAAESIVRHEEEEQQQTPSM